MAYSMKKAYIGNQNEYVDKYGRVRRVRKIVPKFDALFLSKPGQVLEDSIDDFILPKKRKLRKDIAQNLSSGNDSFDCLFKDAENIRKAPLDDCSNAKCTSSEYESSGSSIHFLSPLAVSKGNKPLPNLKYTSPDMFSDSFMTNNVELRSATKENYALKKKKPENGTVRLSPYTLNQTQQNSQMPKDKSRDQTQESNCIVTSTPAFSRAAAKSYLTRLNHISPMEKEFYHNIDTIQSPGDVEYLPVDEQNHSSRDSSVDLSATSSNVNSQNAQRRNFSSRLDHKQVMYRSKRRKSEDLSRILSKSVGMVYKVFDKDSNLGNTGISNAARGIRTKSNQNCTISISLRLSHAKDWKRTLRKTVHLLPEDCLLVKTGTDVNDEVENLQSMTLLESLLVEPDKRRTKKLSEENIFLSLCNQTVPLPLNKFFPKSTLKLGKKIGEGIYGEVFVIKKNQIDDVVKLIPIEGSFNVNEEPQKTFKEILSELVVSRSLNELIGSVDNYCENFPFLSTSKCLQGKYTSELLKLWDKYDKEKGSQNDRPNIFPKDQLYLMLKFNHAGGDLEVYEFSNAMQGYSIFLQVAYALGVAEAELEFEHRDLHWGNVLIKRTEQNNLTYRVKGKEYKVKSRGLKATIIDFTLSRLRDNNCIYFNDLSKDPTLFIAEGDIQFEIYREMKKLNNNQWSEFNPKTNILWLNYLLTKLIRECRYKNKSSKIHKKYITMLKQTSKVILSFESALQFVMDVENR